MLQQSISRLLSLAQFCKAAPPAGFAASKHLSQQWCTPSEFGKQTRLLRSLEKRKTVAVALSGGVDSAVAAFLVKRRGHEVFGIFMRNWDEAEEQGNQNCSVEADFQDAQRICNQLAIPLHVVDFVRDYWTQVFSGFVAQCARGLTPNPDLACNRHIKFDSLLSAAASMGADSVATGHYARLNTLDSGAVQLLRGVDRDKDQSYFLASVRGDALRNVLFPLGDLTKAAVRGIAQDAGLHVARRRSSAGICFIGRRRFGDFLAQYAAPMAGTYINVDTGATVGECGNMAAITYGQRASIGGNSDRMFVVGKDIPGRRVFLALGQEHPALCTHTALLHRPRWLAGHPPGALRSDGVLHCGYMARYRQRLQECTVATTLGFGGVEQSRFTQLLAADYPAPEHSTLRVFMPQAARAITPGQEFVMYDGEVCLGSAPVVFPGSTLAETSEAAESTVQQPDEAVVMQAGCN